MENGWSGDGWTSFPGWFPGKIDYNVWSWQIFPDGTLSWSFWMWNVGWATFSHGVPAYLPKVNCPTSIWNDATQICPVSWSVWSEYAGWIVLDSMDIGMGSGAYFDPNTGNFAGWWWSQNLGWIPFWTWLSGSTLPDSTTPTDPLAGVPINFVSRIAIVGNIAWSRVFSVQNNSVVNQDVGYSYKTVNHTSILNMITKSIALLKRNISNVDLADEDSPYDFILKQDGSDYYIWPGWNPGAINNKRSIIVVGWDIIIDNAVVNADLWSNKTMGMIALKDAAWNGGNIVITDRVKQIYAYMYAEWTVYSWEKTGANIEPYTDGWVWNIPKWQLYIRWFVASKNTIGGSQQKPVPICPVLIASCTAASSYAYDWDYFRTFDYADTSQKSLPVERSGNAKLQNATMIIEYDPDILTDPPPWYQEI